MNFIYIKQHKLLFAWKQIILKVRTVVLIFISFNTFSWTYGNGGYISFSPNKRMRFLPIKDVILVYNNRDKNIATINLQILHTRFTCLQVGSYIKILKCDQDTDWLDSIQDLNGNQSVFIISVEIIQFIYILSQTT